MAEESGQEKTLDASPRKLEQARARGDVPISREGSSFGVYAAPDYDALIEDIYSAPRPVA